MRAPSTVLKLALIAQAAISQPFHSSCPKVDSLVESEFKGHLFSKRANSSGHFQKVNSSGHFG